MLGGSDKLCLRVASERAWIGKSAILVSCYFYKGLTYDDMALVNVNSNG
jgi:hypothetical protein